MASRQRFRSAGADFHAYLYPSFAGSWGTTWIAKEAGYFLDEQLDVELIRVGGSPRMVAAMIGGNASIIQAGAIAAVTANTAGGDVVIIGATGAVSSFRLMARPEIKSVSDLKGKRAGITTFGSTSDQVIRIALKKSNLEPNNKDVALLSLGAQPEVFAALQSGAVQAGAFTFPLYAAAAKLGMRELINFGALGVEDITGTVITTRGFIAKERDTGEKLRVRRKAIGSGLSIDYWASSRASRCSVRLSRCPWYQPYNRLIIDGSRCSRRPNSLVVIPLHSRAR